MIKCLLTVALAFAAAGAHAQFYLDPLTADGAVPFPTDVAVRPDGGYYVLDKRGYVYAIEADGAARPELFLNLDAEVVSSGDRGLLGIALHPDFPARPDVYLYYTALDPTSASRETAYAIGRIARYTATGDGLWTADPASRTVLVGEGYADGYPVCLPFHAGGTLAFAPDRSLLVSVGDAGHAGFYDTGGSEPDCYLPGRADPADDIGSFRAQALASPNGKILRLDPETGRGLPDNPFWTGDPADTASQVWALGLRNPFRFAVDGASPTPRLVIGDVGAAGWEELDVSTGGENFGWPCYEGPDLIPEFAAGAPPGLDCAGPWPGAFTLPPAVWHHSDPDRSAPAGHTASSITGGAFYTGDAYPEPYRGAFVFADFSAGWLMAGRFADGRMQAAERLLDGAPGIVGVAMDPAHDALLVVDIYNGRLLHLRHTGGGPVAPIAAADAEKRTGGAPFAARFVGSGSQSPSGGALRYAWIFGDGGRSAEADPVHVYERPGAYVATLTVTDAAGASSQATVPVFVGRAAPAVAIVEPPSRLVRGDERVTLRAVASDPFEDAAALAASWEVRLLHNGHEHPGFFQIEGTEASFVALPHGDDGEVAFYQATVTVVDGEGISVSKAVALPLANRDAVIASATPAWSGGEARFGRAARVRSVVVAGAAPDSVGVEALVGGAWEPVRFPYALDEPGGRRVLFVPVVAEALRVAPGTLAPSVRFDLGPAVGPPRGLLGVRIGPGPAPTLAQADSALVLSGPASLGDADDVPFVFGSLGLDASVAATVEAVYGGAAGVMVRGSTEPGADAATLAVDAAGALTLTVRQGGAVRVDSLGAAAFPARLRWRVAAGTLVGEAEVEGAWQERARLMGWAPDGLLGGAVLAASGIAAVGGLAVADDPPVVGPGAFVVGRPSPNPTAGRVRFEVASGDGGPVVADVFDLLGRHVASQPVAVRAGREAVVDLDLSALGAGVYAVRLRDEATGAVAVRTLTLLP